MATHHSARNKLAELEDRIGYRFSSHERLVKALTHASASNRPNDRFDYERQEFLGDRVLGLCVAEMLFASFPDAAEGELSVRLNALVSGDTCAIIADEIGLHEFIRAGTDIKHLAGKRMRGVRADVVEALIASIYLDGGLEAARGLIQRYWEKRLHHADAARRDSKTALQEWSHSADLGLPNYRIIEQTGPDHDPLFNVAVEVEGVATAAGTGRSKRAAEQQAAEVLLIREGVWDAPEKSG